jgi:hypothetical protein
VQLRARRRLSCLVEGCADACRQLGELVFGEVQPELGVERLELLLLERNARRQWRQVPVDVAVACCEPRLST